MTITKKITLGFAIPIVLLLLVGTLARSVSTRLASTTDWVEHSLEVDVTLDRIRYFGSQAWSFPRSLMTGFFARAATTAVCVDADEIAWAGWFTREELTAQLEAGTIGLPGPSSIAHRLIATWRSEPTVW